ncbi:hypothetical protein BGZ65_006432 [Modicella reniformis]|uniref:Uncharacterized protein n=1 Tax=Modicella reniformis TaxID=1440133 RepID=A0A9P6ML18_9FUNG|nr:hypothetical protein BGZ65_006432 [Modicella reniformis]
MTPEIQERLRASSVYNSIVQAIKDGQEDQSNQLMGYHQEHKDEVAKIYELTSKILGLTTKNSELMTKVYELITENKGLGTQMIKLQEASDDKQEMRQQQILALKQLSLLQNRVQAIMTQTYEYPIPRLFVVLPGDTSRWDSLKHFSNRFRLYFLKTPHHIHLAQHEGYDVVRPPEFFKQYGSYVLTRVRSRH